MTAKKKEKKKRNLTGFITWYAMVSYAIVSLFTYAISVWGSASNKFQNKALRFGFLEEVTSVTKMLEISDRRLWKSVTSFTDGPLVDLLQPL